MEVVRELFNQLPHPLVEVMIQGMKRLNIVPIQEVPRIDGILLENPISEKALIWVANLVYGTGYQGNDRVRFEEGSNHPDIKEFEDRLLAGAHQNWVEAIIEQTDGVVEVSPISCVEEYERRKRQELWIEASRIKNLNPSGLDIFVRLLLAFLPSPGQEVSLALVYQPF